MTMGYRRKWLGIIIACLIAVRFMPQTVLATTESGVEVTAEPTPTPIPVETNDIAGWPQGPAVSAETACLIDANTGVVLYNKGMTQKMYPASTTKVMTALIVLENASLNETFTFTETGVAEAYSGSSNLITQVGEQFTVEDAVYALMLKSANDFASQIAEYVGGSVEDFVQMMNDKAAELGCVNTHFNNAHGMTDENHYSCAYDLALIMQEACKNPDFCRIAGSVKYVIPATHLTPQRTIETHNGLIMEGESYYDGCIAGKTGYTDAAWCTYVSVAERNGVKLIEATMKTANSNASFSDAKLLYDYGFDNFQNLSMLETVMVYDGGMVTVPKDVNLESIEVQSGDSFETTLGTMLSETYLLNGYVVGSASIPEENTNQQEEIVQEEPPVEEERIPEEPFETEQELRTTAYIVIGVISLLIVIGMVLIVVTLIHQNLERKRGRRWR